MQDAKQAKDKTEQTIMQKSNKQLTHIFEHVMMTITRAGSIRKLMTTYSHTKEIMWVL